MSKLYAVPAHIAARYHYPLPPVEPKGPHPRDDRTGLLITRGSYHFPSSRRLARRATRARRSQ